MTADVVSQETASQTGTPEEAGRPMPTPHDQTAKAQPSTAQPSAAQPSTAQPSAAEGVAAPDHARQNTGAEVPLAAEEIGAMRVRIDEIDQAIIDLWLERSRLSQQVGKTRMASGGTRLVLSREREIVERFRAALGPDGTQVALLLLRSGRGPL